MSGDVACPGDDTLTRFVTGGTVEGERDEIARHLESCSACALIAAVPESSTRTAPRDEDVLVLPLPSARGSLAPGGVLAGRYRIGDLLGVGGMGEVYEAFDLSLRETVALKTVRATIAGNPTVVDLLKSEVQLARRVTHWNVCRIFDFGLHGPESGTGEPTPFLTMELLRGTTLARLLVARRPLSPAQILSIARQIGAGLMAAHAVGVVHKDLKSDNIILTGLDDRSLRATVTDFGLAATCGLLEEEVVERARFSGTPGYIAPERLEGRAANEASDIFALGVVLEDLVTGTLPARRSANRTVPPALEPLLALARRCQAAAPAARPSATPVCAAIDRMERRLGGRRFQVLRWSAGAMAGLAVPVFAVALARSAAAPPLAAPTSQAPARTAAHAPSTVASLPTIADPVRTPPAPSSGRRRPARPRRPQAAAQEMLPRSEPEEVPAATAEAPGRGRDEPIRDLFWHVP